MYKILIVDDEMIVRHAVKTPIRWEGSRFEYVGAAANGAAALNRIQETGADIVITDIKMPEMDGLELIKRLTASGFSGEVLVLSNYDDFELVREALKCGAYDYMLKLTLKTESFMQTLEEIAAKLDARNGAASAPASDAAVPRLEEITPRIAAAIRKLDELTADSEPWEGERFIGADETVYSFVIRLQGDEQGLRQSGEFQDTLVKLADGLFTGSRWTVVIRTGARRFLLAVAYTSETSFSSPEELALRMISLASLYYNVRIKAIYASAASDEDELAAELRLSRQAEELLFYTRPPTGCLSNRETIQEGNEAFKAAETRLRDSMRKPNSGSLVLWSESALELIGLAAEQRVNPRQLKRAVSGGIWSIANSDDPATPIQWDEKRWLEQVEAAETDAQLKETIRELSKEIENRSSDTASPQIAAREEVLQAMRYLEERYPERVAIADVAHHVGLSEPYLCQVFKADTGQSILTYLNEIRMSKAYEMLASGRYLVKQAAIEVGIPDPFYFNRLFKKRFGFSPKNVKTP